MSRPLFLKSPPPLYQSFSNFMQPSRKDKNPQSISHPHQYPHILKCIYPPKSHSYDSNDPQFPYPDSSSAKPNCCHLSSNANNHLIPKNYAYFNN